MIRTPRKHIYDRPWLMVPTGVVLALTVVAANELADAIAGRVAEESRSPSAAGSGRSWRLCPIRHRQIRPPLLEVRSSSISVDGGPVLVSDVSFALASGRVLGLVGESGCGKTMTARALLGLLPDGVSVSAGLDSLAGTPTSPGSPSRSSTPSAAARSR